jgi:hypothetical protein
VTRQKIRALEFKEEFRRFAICSASETIGINSVDFSRLAAYQAAAAPFKKDSHKPTSLTRVGRKTDSDPADRHLADACFPAPV